VSLDSPLPTHREPAQSAALTRSVALQSLDAQAALLPYALVFFGVALPVFTWVCSFAPNRMWMTASFVIFAINWAVFYAQIDWLKQKPDRRLNPGLRTRVHILCGLLWACAVAQICALGLGAGPARESILLAATGAAVSCVFFSAPSLPVLLIVGPAAAASPLLALYADPSSHPLARIALSAIALVMALSLILNRLLRRLFALATERENLVEERARSLCEAETLTKSKSDLIATLSNEIRNGLTGVAHVLAAAGAGGRAAPSREQLNAALASAQELITVLNATLDNERIDALVLERRPFDPARLARDVVLSRRPGAGLKGLELTLHVDPSLIDAAPIGAVVGDPARTQQIMANLVSNAVKYCLRGRIEVRIERLARDRIRLEVADTGPGLSAEELDRAFLPFSRIARTAAGVPGAGLGLSLSRRLATLMGGELSAESAPGVGSCFRLDLPFDPAAVCEPSAPPAAAADERASGDHPRALRVLIAEDDPLNAAMLRAALEQLGHHVLHAHDGRRAFELAKTCDVEMIILNGRLPLMDGPEIAGAIRGLAGAAAQAPIIAVIDGDAEEAQAFLEAGVNEVLRKPVTVAGIARAVASASCEAPPQAKRRRQA
jgi:signal transduction histidine kinase/CheY-like chemotaxis protein